MKLKTTLKRFTALMLVFGSFGNVYPQALGTDPALRHGKLRNGFTYYIRKNVMPKGRATIYLVSKAGSILEGDDQLGLAHFIEHMSFNGSRHFPKNRQLDYLQKCGIRFGADLNAYTSFNETVYELPIPTDDQVLWKNGLQIVRDWAQEATLEGEEIERERGIVLEEMRLNRGARQRMQDQILPVLLNGSRYVFRTPIGTEKIIRNFSHQTIRTFYRDWYRPDLQAVIIVGDIDVEKVRKQVIGMYSDLRIPRVPRTRNNYAVELKGKNSFKVVTDPEKGNAVIDIYIKRKEQPVKTEQDFRKAVVKRLFSEMFTLRMQQQRERAAGVLKNLTGGFSPLMGGLETFSVQIVPYQGRLKPAFEQAWAIISAVKTDGFSADEFRAGKNILAAQIRSQKAGREAQSSTILANSYKKHFLTGSAVFGPQKEYQLMEKFAGLINLSELNSLAAASLLDIDRDIILTAPEKDKNNLPDAPELSAWMVNAIRATPEPFHIQNKTAEGLMSKLPAKGRITSSRDIPEMGITEWVLSNGARVVLKPTQFKNDQILILASSHGGTSCYAESDFQSAANSAGMVSSFGIGRFSGSELAEITGSRKISMQPFISETGEGLSGSSTTAGLGAAMELIHLYFTAPRKDKTVFDRIIHDSAEGISQRYTDPNAVFADSVSAVLGSYHPRRTGPTLDKLKQIELERMVDIYKERYANAGDFTFFFVGNIDMVKCRELVSQYIASLPDMGIRERVKDLGIRTPGGKLSKTVRAGFEDKASVRLMFGGDYQFSLEDNLNIMALQEILQYRLESRLRENEGGVYSPNVSSSHRKKPVGRFSFTVSFGCSTANVERMISAALEEMEAMVKKGISQDDLGKFKAEQVRQNELALADNGFWLGYLNAQYMDEGDIHAFPKLVELMKKLSPQILQKAAGRFFNKENYIRFVLLPAETS